MGDELRLLVVEADSEANHVLSLFLDRFGTFCTATTLKDAVEAIEQNPPDVLLLDPDLPDGDGMDLVQNVRLRMPWAQVFILCAEPRSGDIGLFIEAGANDVICRPFDIAAFLPRADRLCRAVGVRKEEVSRLQHIEARLRHADGLALLGTALATLAHEVANPLSVIQASAGIMKADLQSNQPLDSAARQDLAETACDIEEAAKAIKAFVMRIRGLARRDLPQPERLAIGPTISTALLFLRQKLAVSGVSITSPASADTPSVSHVPGRLVQAVSNAVANAIESTGPGGHIAIRCLEMDRQVVIEIEDDGPGITAESRQQAMEPFFTTKPTGTGLGMSVMRDVMRDHGGRVELTDAQSGKGLCVKLILPQD
jgi:signal transduction histidine kinase